MAELFQIGDRIEAIAGSPATWALSMPVRIGQRGTVNELPPSFPNHVGVLYDNGHDCYSHRSAIRKLPPPSADTLDTDTPNQVTQWADGPWKPESLHV